jgi:hypothetical protein
MRALNACREAGRRGAAELPARGATHFKLNLNHKRASTTLVTHFTAKKRGAFPNLGEARDVFRGATSDKLQYSAENATRFRQNTRVETHTLSTPPIEL